MSNRQFVSMKVLKVEEGLKEMVVEKKYTVRGENGKKQNQVGPASGPLKLIPSIEDVTIESKSDEHMVLPYSPYMKHIHPRASDKHQVTFLVDGSFLTYLPSPSEFSIDTENIVVYDPENRHQLFFKRDVAGEDISTSHSSLWFCTSLQSSKTVPLLRCEQVGTGIIDDIPIDNLSYAIRNQDLKSVPPYTTTPSSAHTTSSHSNKMLHKKHGKADVSDHIHSSMSHG
jgi:hypothetical protein